MENEPRFDLSQHLAHWRESLLASEAMDPDRVRELESHLHEAMAELRGKGLSEEAAFWAAAQRLGDSRALAAQFELLGTGTTGQPRAIWAALVRELPLVIGVFLLGTVVGFFFLLPQALRASGAYATWLGLSAGWPRENYVRFACKFVLGAGLGFAMPMAILGMVKQGWVTANRLVAFRKYMLVINLILGAILTTPEILTQLLMAIPLQLLYEVSILRARCLKRKNSSKIKTASN